MSLDADPCNLLYIKIRIGLSTAEKFVPAEFHLPGVQYKLTQENNSILIMSVRSPYVIDKSIIDIHFDRGIIEYDLQNRNTNKIITLLLGIENTNSIDVFNNIKGLIEGKTYTSIACVMAFYRGLDEMLPIITHLSKGNMIFNKIKMVNSAIGQWYIIDLNCTVVDDEVFKVHFVNNQKNINMARRATILWYVKEN